MANEAEELAQRLLSLLGSRVPHHSRGAFGQTVGQELWRITATGDQLAVLDEATALIRRQQQQYAMLDEVCAGQAERIAQLEAAIQRHNDGCQDVCGRSDQEAVRCGYRTYFEHSGRRCPNCPIYDVIEVGSSLPTGEPRG